MQSILTICPYKIGLALINHTSIEEITSQCTIYFTTFVICAYSFNQSYDSAAAVLASYKLYADALPFYVMQGDYTNAQLMHDSLAYNNSSDSLYGWLTQKAIDLYSAGHSWQDLDSASKDSLTRITQYDNQAGYMAGATSNQLSGTVISWPVPVVDYAVYDSVAVDSDAMRQAYNNLAVPAIQNVNQQNAQIALYPNPNTGNFTVSSNVNCTLYINDVAGRMIGVYTIPAGKQEVQLPETLAAGIYMGLFRSNTGAQKEVRISYEP